VDVGIPYIYAELGRRDEAEAALKLATSRGISGAKHDYQLLPAMTSLADVCAFLDDAPLAAELYELLLPYAGQNIVALEGWFCFGSADRALGVLTTTMQRWEAAERHFAAAIALNTKIGARPWLARTQMAYAHMLLARNGPRDADLARTLLGQALDVARELGMTVVAGRIEAQLAAATT
jgi:tetratricopeptide (TPR) repeat protein